MTSSLRPRPALWIAIWATLVVAMLFIRPAIPIDETRYLAVAWEMWWRHSIAVPYLNQEYYDGKPPLLFWLMQLGWLAAGVNEWWPRLIAPLAGFGCLVLVRLLARRLWPTTSAADFAPFVLLGSLYWALFCASTMFDTLLGVFALMAVYNVVRAAQDGAARHFVGAGLSLGLGILAKGPVVFLPCAWIVLSAPWWMNEASRTLWTWPRWYGTALIAVLLAGLIAMLWLGPMALSSDAAYVKDMLFHQTGGYVVESFSHRRPLWWYLPLLPLLLFPWFVWPAAWRGVGAFRAVSKDPGLRLCAVWAIGVLLTFSLISGKQAHYLLLAFPAVGLLLARLLPEADTDTDASVLVPALLVAILGMVVLALATGWVKLSSAAWSREAPRHTLYIAGIVFLVLATLIAGVRRASLSVRVPVLSAATCAAVLTATWGTMTAAGGAYDVRPASAYLARLVAQGAPIAIAGKYEGQFNFYGRIQTRLQEIAPATAPDWASRNGEGYVVAFLGADGWPPRAGAAPTFQSLYRGGGLAVWRARDIVATPELVQDFR